MLKPKYFLTTGVMLCSAISGLAVPMANTFAEGSSSYFDAAGKNCIIDNYNAEFSALKK